MSERYAKRRAMHRALRPATRKRLQNLTEDAVQLAPAILKDVIMHNLSKPLQRVIKDKAPWMGNVKLSHRLEGGQYEEVPLIRQRAAERRRRKERYRSRKQRKPAEPKINAKDYISNPSEYDYLFDEFHAAAKSRKGSSRRKDTASVSSCDSNCSCRSSDCSTCSSSGSDVSMPDIRVRKPRRQSRSQSSSPPSDRQPLQATFNVGKKEYRLGVPIPDPKIFIDDFFNPPPEKVPKKSKRRDASAEPAGGSSRRRRSRYTSYSTSPSCSDVSSGSSISRSRESHDTAGGSRSKRRSRSISSSSESSSDRSFISNFFRPKRQRSGRKPNRISSTSSISVESLSSSDRSSVLPEELQSRGGSGSEQDTANDMPVIVDKSKLPPAKLYRRKSFKHAIDRATKTERRARSVHYPPTDRPVAVDIQAHKDAAEAHRRAQAAAQAEAEAQAKPAHATRADIETTRRIKRKLVAAKKEKLKSRQSAFREHLSSEDDSEAYARVFNDAAHQTQEKKKKAEEAAANKAASSRRSSMDGQKEEEVTNASSGAAP